MSKESSQMYFKQLKDKGDNFSYIIADGETRDAIVIDPNFNTYEVIKMLRLQRLTLRFIVNTHGHYDHTAGNQELKNRCGGKIVAHHTSSIPKDLGVKDGDILAVGNLEVRVIHTPGHTHDSICLLVDRFLFTGDTLFVGECGRTDLDGGNSIQMYDSLFNKLLKLDDGLEVYPGHDYGPKPKSTIGEEKKTNYTLQNRTLEEFIEFMRMP
ncbi:MAG: MBL fold metallo-hydrolase [Candidatus Bathyarchaeia archaeon]